MAAGLATDVWKQTIDHYVSAASTLYRSMVQGGFDDRCPIPVDPFGEILNGSHRLACALALDLESVPVDQKNRPVWAPPWGEAWFKDNGLEPRELEAIRWDMDYIAQRRGL